MLQIRPVLLFFVTVAGVLGLRDDGEFPRIIPGAIFDYEGPISLIKEYVTVDIKFDDLVYIPSMLTFVSQDVKMVRAKLQDVKDKHKAEHTELIQQIFETLAEAEETITTAMAWFPENHKDGVRQFNGKRVKRGLVNVVGSGFKYLFGVATQDDVSKLNDRITTVEEIRKQNDMILENLHSASQRQNEKINEIISQCNRLVHEGFDLALNVHILEQLTTLSHLAIRITMNLQKQFISLKSTVDSIILATTGIVTSDLLSFSELDTILLKAVAAYDVKPLFTTHDLYLYYSYLKVQVAPYHIFVHIPMSADTLFHHFHIIPFPTFHYNVSIILNDKDTHILVSDGLNLYTELTREDIAMCRLHGKKKICESYHLPLKQFVDTCVTVLMLKHVADTLEPRCSYNEIRADYAVKPIRDAVFIHNPHGEQIRVGCNHTYISRDQNIKVPITCSLESKFFILEGLSQKHVRFHKLHAPMWRVNTTEVVWERPRNISFIKPLQMSNSTFTLIDHKTTHVVMSTTSVALAVITCVLVVTLIITYKYKCSHRSATASSQSHGSELNVRHVAA